MSTTTGVHAMVRRTHEGRVLSALRAFGALSRAELAERVGLSRTTLSEITATLVKRGAVVVVDTDAALRRGSGRPAERLALDPAAGQFLGVDFGHRRVQVAVADASHEIIASGVERYDDGTGWTDRIAAALGLVDRLAREHGLHFGALQAVGIGVPGPYTRAGAGGAHITWKQHTAPDGVDAAFAERFGSPVMVDNNTRLAALAEAVSRPEPLSDLVYVRLSDGVGGGLVVAGRLVTGARGFAGELGHVTADPAGAECRCGKRGCLETVASVPAILTACRARGAGTDSLDDLAAAVAKHDPVVDAVLRDAGSALGRVLGAAAMALDPDEVVVGGEIVHVAPVVVEQAAATLRYEMYAIPAAEPIRVRAGRLRDSDGALGALTATFHESPLLAGYPETTAEEEPQRSAP
ncbi:ROK family transcriptional regulator [Myceligenerans pegani]|uniref:ROK family transcriptional regulator n=1 Tax=Myceligenerans pegani TaxID=2776917 RepID=A0ABR9N4Y9_9MICO|nr:ROK family transcriptional regulator [Myceligenerans sp. TRM 65318]MBE1878410.1 ROK family transcriptional regulator [Myceligenerans sp. TRM 65318]MBE3020681.1 ROK family transcriptional regulator [Myceligenerans sp. TRM 65318]